MVLIRYVVSQTFTKKTNLHFVSKTDDNIKARGVSIKCPLKKKQFKQKSLNKFLRLYKQDDLIVHATQKCCNIKENFSFEFCETLNQFTALYKKRLTHFTQGINTSMCQKKVFFNDYMNHKNLGKFYLQNENSCRLTDNDMKSF